MENKNYQEFIAFIRDPALVEAVQQFRQKRLIDPGQIKILLQRIAENEDEMSEISLSGDERKETRQMDKQNESYRSLAEFMGKKVCPKDIANLLYRFKKPASWEQPLLGYIVTGVIRTPDVSYHILREPKGMPQTEFIRIELYSNTVRTDYVDACKRGIRATQSTTQNKCNSSSRRKLIKITKKRDRVWVDFYTGVTVREARLVYQKVFKALERLPGAYLRTIRKRSCLSGKVLKAKRFEYYKNIGQETVRYKNPVKGEPYVFSKKQDEKRKLVDMVKNDATDMPEEIREELSEKWDDFITKDEERTVLANVRQTKRRVRRFLSK